MGALLNQWKTAKQLFKTTAKVKKPSAWANDGRVVSDDATRADVLRELKLFEKAVLGVKAWAK